MTERKAKETINIGMEDAVTLLWGHLFTPRKFKRNGKETGEPKFSGNFLMPLTSENAKDLKAAAVRVAKEQWPGVDLKALKMPFSNGDAEAKKSAAKGKDGKFYEGNLVLRTSSNEANAPALLTTSGAGVKDATALDEKKFYNGAKVAIEIVLTAYDAYKDGDPDGITAYINVVCFVEDGPRIAGKDHTATFANVRGKEVDENPLGNTSDEDDLGL